MDGDAGGQRGMDGFARVGVVTEVLLQRVVLTCWVADRIAVKLLVGG